MEGSLEIKSGVRGRKGGPVPSPDPRESVRLSPVYLGEAERLSPELMAIGTALSWPRSSERARELSLRCVRDIDWAKLLRLSERHRVVGLVRHALVQAGVVLPSEIEAGLALRAQQITFQELALANELNRITVALDLIGIKAVVLKGLTVSAQAYGRVGLRQNFDIDLLVDPAEVAAAISVLEAQNFRQAEPADRLDGRSLELWMRSHKEIAFSHRTGAHIVELHWRLLDNHLLAVGLADFKPQLVELPTGAHVYGLPLAASFLFMGAHGAQHAWSRLKWLADFSAVAGRLGSSAVEGLYASARGDRVGPALAQGLALSEIFFGAQAPPQVHVDIARSWRLRSACDAGA